MGFSVFVWNMQQRPSAWEYLDRPPRPDVALLQEAGPSPSSHRGLQKTIGSRIWGSAVLSPHGVTELTEIETPHTKGPVPLVRHNPGAVIAGSVAIPGEEAPIIAVSLYGVQDSGYNITTVHRALSDLTLLMDSSLRHRVIVGGDLNASSQLPAPYRAWHKNLFERFELLGLIDLTGQTADSRPPLEGCPCEDEPCRHVQTFRRRDAAPYQDDWIFASDRLAERVESVTVDNAPDSEAWSHSDHAPLRAVFH
jgi:hypothetical protein